MPYYGQLHDQTKVGNSNLTEAEAGCFNYSFRNLLAHPPIGIDVNPDDLNNAFTAHNLYIYDATDHANDDLYWNTITALYPQLVVNQTVIVTKETLDSLRFPTSDLAIVKFYYQSVQSPWLDQAHTKPNMITHFCAVNSAADHSIIDSWDGLVKTPAEYEHIYHQPIAWATYTYHTPATVPASLPPSAPVSAPKAISPTPQPPAPSAPHQLVMPKTDHYYLWHVYKEGGPYTLPSAIGVLDPYHYGPLTYDILGNPAPNIYIIQTQSFGRVAVYAGPDTVAQFPTGHGEGEDTTPVPTTSIPVSEVVPAPIAPIEPTAPSAPVAPAIVYALVDGGPLRCLTKEGAQSYNFVNQMIIENKPTGSEFIAYGKATMPDHTTYFMEQSEFGDAATTQQPQTPLGIKTSDLQLAPAEPEIVKDAPQTPAEVPQDAIPIHVNVTHASNPSRRQGTLPWQEIDPIIPGDSKENPQSEDYIVINDIKVYNFATGNDVKMAKKGWTVSVVGTFWFADHKYYLPKSSFDKGTWYGFPVSYPAPSLVKKTAQTTPFETNDDINQIEHECEEYISRSKNAAIKVSATAEGLLARLRKGKI